MPKLTPKQLEELRKVKFSSIREMLTSAAVSPQIKAAISAGLTESLVSRVETEGITRQMTLEQLYAYSQAYGVDYPSLVQQSRLGG